MNIIRALLIIRGCLSVGETAVYLSGIKLPSSIIGMGVLSSCFRQDGSNLHGCKS